MSALPSALECALRQARRIAITALVGGLIAATLVRFSPGFDTDQQDLDFGLSNESHRALRAARSDQKNVLLFYAHYLAGLVRGDLGFSRSLNRPVGELLAERVPETARSMAYGVAGGLAAGFALAAAAVFWNSAAAGFAGGLAGGLFLSTPVAVLALVFLWTGANARWAVALLVFPHVYRYSKNVLEGASRAPHVLAAHARGVSAARAFLSHILVPSLPQLAELFGMSATIAFGACIGVEALCDMPGVGQLVWKAALGRDLPLLLAMTLLVALATVSINASAEILLAAWGRSAPAQTCEAA